MEIQERYLSVESAEDGDIITFLDEGVYVDMKSKDGSTRKVINFNVNNGRYDLIYTPGTTAQKILMKAFSRDTANWVGKKFQVKLVDSLSFGKPTRLILPQPVVV